MSRGPIPRVSPAGWTFEEADVEEAARFYGVLFGWTFLEAERKRRYLIAQLDGQDAAGIGRPSAANDSATSSATWNTYIAVRDIDEAAARVAAAGGRVTEPPSNVGEAGRNGT
jgi:uncharacterized protein